MEVVVGVLAATATAVVVDEVDRSSGDGVTARCRVVSWPRRAADQPQSGAARNQRIDP